jgi:hypothetical protein
MNQSNQPKMNHPDFLPLPTRTLPTDGGILGKNDFKPVSVLGQGTVLTTTLLLTK